MPDTAQLNDTFPESRATPAEGDAAFAGKASAPPSVQYPPAALLHFCILLTGFGTVFLGPLLPAFTGLLHLSDRGAGTLLAAQFIGAFLGGWTTSAPLRRSMLRGLAASALGFALLGFVSLHAPQLHWALPVLALLGFGIGQTLTSTNLVASQKWSTHRGAALNLLNFSWSFGAFTAPVLLLRLVRSVSVSSVLYTFVTLLFAGLLATWLDRSHSRLASSPERTEMPTALAGIGRPAYVFFGFLLFLYGGVETSLGGWLTTFDHRYAAASGWQGMAISTTAFWGSLTVARLLAPAILRRVPERLLLRLGLASATIALLLMLGAHGTPAIAVCAALAGLSLSPWFPLVLSVLVAQGPTAAQAGRVIAVSGLGAAALPWLVGQVSAASGSLRIALLLPAAGTLGLLLLTFNRLLEPSKTIPLSRSESV